jgi:hypothetical protein
MSGLNPAIYASLATSRVGEVESTAMVMSYDEFTASRFYREWAQPQGYCDGLWAILEKSATAIASISILRHERMGLTDDATRRRLELLAPQFRRAVAIGKVIDLNKAATASLADALDGLADGIFLVDADSRIVHVNARGHAMVAEGKFLKAIYGRLAAMDAQATKACATCSPRPTPVMRRSAPEALHCRSRRGTVIAGSPTCFRSLRRPAQGRHRLCRGRRRVRAQGGARLAVAAADDGRAL